MKCLLIPDPFSPAALTATVWMLFMIPSNAQESPDCPPFPDGTTTMDPLPFLPLVTAFLRDEAVFLPMRLKILPLSEGPFPTTKTSTSSVRWEKALARRTSVTVAPLVERMRIMPISAL